MMCCGLVCGCLTENNKEIQCPHSFINVERVVIEVCGKPNQPIECDYCK